MIMWYVNVGLRQGLAYARQPVVVPPFRSPLGRMGGRSLQTPNDGPWDANMPKQVPQTTKVPTFHTKPPTSWLSQTAPNHTEAAHKWAKWLRHPCRLGDPHRCRAGGKSVLNEYVRRTGGGWDKGLKHGRGVGLPVGTSSSMRSCCFLGGGGKSD